MDPSAASAIRTSRPWAICQPSASVIPPAGEPSVRTADHELRSHGGPAHQLPKLWNATSKCLLMSRAALLTRKQFPPQPVPQRYPPSGSPMSAYGTPIAPPAVPQPWAQPMYAQPSMSPRVPPPGSGPAQIGIPYAYGQLPANANPNDPKSQHPIPGSYNRNHAFNPKTQSFIPGGNMMQPVPPPQPPFTAPGSHHSSPQIGTPPLAYGGFAPAAHPGYGAGYMMARQGSTGSMPGYAPAMHVGPPMTSAMPHGVPQNPHGPAHIPGRPPVQQGPNTMYTHLPTYGNPATLPQKPASGI